MTKKNPSERNMILFIDDEKICHTLVDLIIPNFTKYHIINAFNSTEAIALARRYENNICLVLSDIMLPDINGYDLYSMFKQDPKLCDIPFIFQSGLATQEKELREKVIDEVEIIYKPYKQVDLLDIIFKVLK